MQTANVAQPRKMHGLMTLMETIELPLYTMSREEVDLEYEQACSRIPIESPWAERILDAMRQWRNDTLHILKETSPETIPTDLQVLRIGPVDFVAISAEAFSRMADELRKLHKRQTYVIGYANGQIGYLPFREIYAEGGYEINDSYKYRMNFMIAPGGYEILRDQAVQLLRYLDSPHTPVKVG